MGSRKKDLLLMAGQLRGGGVKGQAIKKKGTFFGTFFSNVPKAIQLEGGWGLGLNCSAIKRRFFLRLPCVYCGCMFPNKAGGEGAGQIIHRSYRERSRFRVGVRACVFTQKMIFCHSLSFHFVRSLNIYILSLINKS